MHDCDPHGRFVLEDASLAYHDDDGTEIPAVKGLILDPPARKNTDVYEEAVGWLRGDTPALVVLVDGLGWHQYLHMTAHGRMPFLASREGLVQALAVYPSITPVNFAAAVTGALPPDSGIITRNTRVPEVPTIFQWAEDRGLRSALVMGPISPIEFGITPTLVTRADADGCEDSAIFERSMALIEDEYDLLFVHFKSPDTVGHAYGAFAEETLATIDTVDGYLSRLHAAWDGRMVVFSDHGMKTMDDGTGEHGMLLYDDMYVPQWSFDGGATSP